MTPLLSTSDETLMADYVAGDPHAFDALFSRYQPMLTRLVRRRVPHLEEARDVVQQTFLQMHCARNRFHAGRLVRPWLLTIAANLSRDHARRCRHWREIPGDCDVAAPALPDPFIQAADRARVRRAIAELPPMYREVLAMQWLDGLSYSEIAAELGSSYAAIKLRAFRARAALRAVLEADASELCAA